jgi:hypothetical protein
MKDENDLVEEEQGELQEIEINLNMMNEKQLDELFNPFVMFGGAVKTIMRQMFGTKVFPVKISGSKNQVSAFAKAIAGEKKYIKTAAKYGLDNPRTYKDKYKLKTAISKFERATGLKWPVK